MRRMSALLGGVFQPLAFQSFATNCSISEMIFSPATLSADLYVILCASLATIAFSINFMQMLVIVFLSRCWKSLYLLNGCVCGMITACALMYHAVIENPPEVRAESHGRIDLARSREHCNVIPAIFTIIMFIGYTANLTAVICHKFLASLLPGLLNSVGRNRFLCLLFSTISTAQVAVLCISLMQPWSANIHTRVCLPPYQWGETFTKTVAAMYSTQMLICTLCLLDLTMTSRRERNGKTVDSLDLQVLWLKYFLLALSTVPFAALTIYHSLAIERNLCFVVKDSVQVWTLVATVLLASAIPAVHVLSDQVICRGTLYLLQRLLCINREDHAIDGAFIPPTSPTSPEGRSQSRRFDHLPSREQFILRMSGSSHEATDSLESLSIENRSVLSQQFNSQPQTDVMY